MCVCVRVYVCVCVCVCVCVRAHARVCMSGFLSAVHFDTATQYSHSF